MSCPTFSAEILTHNYWGKKGQKEQDLNELSFPIFFHFKSSAIYGTSQKKVQINLLLYLLNHVSAPRAAVVGL